MPSLTYLNASHGVIVEIDDTAFSNLATLQFLDLSFNNITKITLNMFAPLKNLWFMSLSYNHIKILDDYLFNSNIKLKYLYLDHNDIAQIDGAITYQNFANVVTLSYNELTSLDTASISAVNVWADHNRLQEIRISSGVSYLNANENYIKNLICGESEISVLYLQNNTLTELGCITSLTQLTNLNLNFNNFGKLNQSSFAALTELETLSLKSANIGKLEYGVFSHQSNLKILDISYNHMGNIAMEMLLAAKGLQKLYIDGNNITEFSYTDIQTAFTGFKTISIGDNDFNCTFLAQAVKQLNSFHVDAIFSEGNKVTDSHNVNGIGCQVKQEKITPSWVPSVERNKNTTDGTIKTELDVKVDAIIQQVEKLSGIKAESDKVFAKFSDDIIVIKQQLTKLSHDVLSNQAEILKLELAKGNNLTNSSNTMMWTLINQLNNITLEKQQVSNRGQMQEINELKFQIDKNSYKSSDNSDKIEKLMKKETVLHSSSTSQNGSNSDYDLIRNLNIILITLIVAFCIYKGYKFVKNDVPRIRRYNTANTLNTNIEMDNSSTR